MDYLTLAAGEMVLGLYDAREHSATRGCSQMLRIQAADPHLAVVPTGVCHGFYFPEPATHVYAVSEGFDGSDEFGCRWNAPELMLHWPCDAPVLSERDRGAGSFPEMLETWGGAAP